MSEVFLGYAMAEVRRDGTWMSVGELFTSPWYRPDEPPGEGNPPKSRYYAWLYENDGHPLSDVLSTIGMQKGWPEDATKQVNPDPNWQQYLFEQSWITLKALLEGILRFDWKKPYKHSHSAGGRHTTYREAVDGDFWTFVGELWRLGDPEDVRILHLILQVGRKEFMKINSLLDKVAASHE